MYIPMRLNSGSKDRIDCMTGFAIAKRAASGSWSGLLLSLLVFAFGLPAWGAGMDVTTTLKGVEDRYNGVKTLQLLFTENYKLQGRQLTEKGELFLRKPGRMRWQYTAPAGKLFVSDGKFIYSYVPQDKRAEKTKLKETDDMKAPLAFLLGEVDFHRDFKEFRSHPEEGGLFITAIPKSDKMPYSEVSFLAGPDFTIRRLEVKGQDGSNLRFVFENEKMNPPVQDSLFRFTPPPGVEYTDLSNAP